MRCTSESCRLTIWKSQCTSSTCGFPRSLQKVTAPSAALNMIGLSLPNRVARLISAIGRPLLDCRRSRPTRPRALRHQSQVVGIRGRSPGAQPRRPPQVTFTAETDARHLVARQHELHFPIELEPDVVPHPVPEPFEATAARQEGGEAIEIHGPHHGPEPALDVAHTLAHHGAVTERPAHPWLAAQRGSLVAGQLEPTQHELIHARGEAEKSLQDGSEAFGVLRVTRQVPGEE